MQNNFLLRVAVSNNFNYTKKEIQDVEKLKNHYKYILLNSHKDTNIKNNNLPVFVTSNPQLINKTDFNINGSKENVKAIRLKIILSTNKKYIKTVKNILSYAEENNISVLITIFRFYSAKNRKKILNLLQDNFKFYRWDRNYYRIKDNKIIKNFVDRLNRNIQAKIYFCDYRGGGCLICNNCSKLSYNKKLQVKELNLQSSGFCKFNCIECFAKRLIHKNGNRISFNTVRANKKMNEKIKNVYTNIDQLLN